MNLTRAVRDWRVKGLVQGTLSLLPRGESINDRLQVALGDLKRFDNHINGKVDDWIGIMSYLAAVGRRSVMHCNILEIGSGWCPTLPVCFNLAGAQRVFTVDLRRHMDRRLTLRMISVLEAHVNRIAERSQTSEMAAREAYGRLRSSTDLNRLLSAANITYKAPQNAANLESVADESFDIVYSNSVLEHVSPEDIPLLMQEAWRVLKPDGVLVHAVACNDHYAHFDRTISFLNYLQYTDRQWRYWNNRFNYQNRLRAPEFIRFAQENGFAIVKEARAYRPGSLEALSRMRVAPQFAGYNQADLAATTVDFVAVKAR